MQVYNNILAACTVLPAWVSHEITKILTKLGKNALV